MRKKSCLGPPANQAAHASLATLLSSGFGRVKSQIAISIREDPRKLPTGGPWHWRRSLSLTEQSHIVTLLELVIHLCMLIKVPSKDTAVVVTH